MQVLYKSVMHNLIMTVSIAAPYFSVDPSHLPVFGRIAAAQRRHFEELIQAYVRAPVEMEKPFKLVSGVAGEMFGELDYLHRLKKCALGECLGQLARNVPPDEVYFGDGYYFPFQAGDPEPYFDRMEGSLYLIGCFNPDPDISRVGYVECNGPVILPKQYQNKGVRSLNPHFAAKRFDNGIVFAQISARKPVVPDR